MEDVTLRRLGSLVIALTLLALTYWLALPLFERFGAIVVPEPVPAWVGRQAGFWLTAFLMLGAAFLRPLLFPSVFNVLHNRELRPLDDRVLSGVAIMLVPGTEDTKPTRDDEDPRWWEARSPLVRLLNKAVAKSPSVTIESLPWSGANSEAARDLAALELARRIKARSRERRAVILVGHSHGANVARMAIRRLTSKELPHCVFAVGTPFFVYSDRNRFIGMALSLISAAAIAILGGAVISWALPYAMAPASAAGAALSLFLVLVGVNVSLMGAFLLLAVISGMGQGIVRRSSPHQTPWYLLSADLDEALSVLFRISKPVLSPGAFEDFLAKYEQPERRRAMLAAAAIVFSVVSIGLIALAMQLGLAILIAYPLAMLVALVAAIAARRKGGRFVLRVYRRSIYWRQEAQGWLGDMVIRNVSYGDDVGAGITDVHHQPGEPIFKQLPISQACIDDIEAAVQAAIGDTWRELRGQLAKDRMDGKSRPIPDFGKVISWKELTHTLYFKVPSFCQILVGHICDEIDRSGATLPGPEQVRRDQKVTNQPKPRQTPWRPLSP